MAILKKDKLGCSFSCFPRLNFPFFSIKGQMSMPPRQQVTQRWHMPVRMDTLMWQMCCCRLELTWYDMILIPIRTCEQIHNTMCICWVHFLKLYTSLLLSVYCIKLSLTNLIFTCGFRNMSLKGEGHPWWRRRERDISAQCSSSLAKVRHWPILHSITS